MFFDIGTVGWAQFGLSVTIQVFVEIDLGRARREIEDFSLIISLCLQRGEPLGAMHFQNLGSQKYFLATIGNKYLHLADDSIVCRYYFNELETG